MSDLTIASYFPLRRIKINNQIVDPDAAEAWIEIQPHKSFKPTRRLKKAAAGQDRI